jgi:hypothetical protein
VGIILLYFTSSNRHSFSCYLSLQNLLDRSKYDKQLQDFKYGTAIHFNKLFNIDESKYLRIPTLTMWVSCKDIKDLEIAIKIFYSIHFPK